jgi:hypothetical protein
MVQGSTTVHVGRGTEGNNVSFVSFLDPLGYPVHLPDGLITVLAHLLGEFTGEAL